MRRVKKEISRMLSALLVAAMIVTLMPQETLTAWASEATVTDPGVVESEKTENTVTSDLPENEEAEASTGEMNEEVTEPDGADNGETGQDPDTPGGGAKPE